MSGLQLIYVALRFLPPPTVRQNTDTTWPSKCSVLYGVLVGEENMDGDGKADEGREVKVREVIV